MRESSPNLAISGDPVMLESPGDLAMCADFAFIGMCADVVSTGICADLASGDLVLRGHSLAATDGNREQAVSSLADSFFPSATVPTRSFRADRGCSPQLGSPGRVTHLSS